MKKKKNPFDFPAVDGGISMTGKLKSQTQIPEDFPITKCKPSRRGSVSNRAVRPRKRGRPLSWIVAEALAPDANKSYEEQIAESTVTSVRHLSPEEAEIVERIEKLQRENKKLKDHK